MKKGLLLLLEYNDVACLAKAIINDKKQSKANGMSKNSTTFKFIKLKI